MYTYDIRFFPRPDAEVAEYANLVDAFLCTLSRNNQIIFETLNVSTIDGDLVARVSIPFPDSLDSCYYDSYTREMLDRLLEQSAKEPQYIHIGEEGILTAEWFATGQKAPFYVLHTEPYFADLSPIRCGHCNGIIPQYLLPPLSAEDAADLGSWHLSYNAYHKLYMASGIGELSAHRMLSAANSSLNRKGIELANRLTASLDKPVYYYLFRFYGKHPKTCPICKGDWKQSEDSLYDYRCDNCRLVADKTV